MFMLIIYTIRKELKNFKISLLHSEVSFEHLVCTKWRSYPFSKILAVENCTHFHHQRHQYSLWRLQCSIYFVSTYVCECTYMCIYVHIYIYIKRERERVFNSSIGDGFLGLREQKFHRNVCLILNGE